MPEFTRADRALMIRIGSHLRDAAQTEANGYGLNWAADEEAKAAKRRHDRLLRDEHDLGQLRRRLEAQVPPVTPGAGS